MSGFPTRPARATFGPKPVNRFAVRDPERELDGPTIGDLMMWQLAGVGVTCPVAWAYISVDGAGVPTITSSGEAWDPDSASVPGLTDNGNGSYKVTYAATYHDKDLNDVTTNLIGAAAFVQSINDYRAVAQVQANRREVEVRVRNAAGAPTDPAAGDEGVLVVVW